MPGESALNTIVGFSPEGWRLRPNLFRLAAVAWGLFLCTTSTLAQRPAQRWELFAEGGASVWNDHFLDSSIQFGSPPVSQTVLLTTHVASSGRLFAGFLFWMNPHEAIEASYSYAPADITESQRCEHVNCGSAWFPTIAHAHFFAVNYVHEFRVKSRVRPFLTAGLGIIDVHRVAMNGVLESDPFTINIGGGIEFRASAHWFIRAEYRDWVLEGPRENDFYQYAATGLTHNQVPSIGVAYRF